MKTNSVNKSLEEVNESIDTRDKRADFSENYSHLPGLHILSVSGTWILVTGLRILQVEASSDTG